jgi:hypothetical protein
MTVILSRTAAGNFTVTILERTGGFVTGTHSHHSQLGVLYQYVWGTCHFYVTQEPNYS